MNQLKEVEILIKRRNSRHAKRFNKIATRWQRKLNKYEEDNNWSEYILYSDKINRNIARIRNVIDMQRGGVELKLDKELKLEDDKLGKSLVVSKKEKIYLYKVKNEEITNKELSDLFNKNILTTLETLETLDLSGCTALTELPDSISKLKALTKLNLSGCTALTKLPDSIGELNALTELNLSGCKLATLPDSIWKLSSLKNLNLNNASLKTLKNGVFLGLNLDTLYISGFTCPNRYGNILSCVWGGHIIDYDFPSCTKFGDDLNTIAEIEMVSDKLSAMLNKRNPKWESLKNRYWVRNIELDPNVKLIQVGDIHGSYPAFMVLLETFKDNGIIDDDLKVTDDYAICFCGDYVDRSLYSIECLGLLCILFNINDEDKIILLAGNHENKDTMSNYGAITEMEYELNLENRQIIYGLLEKLPFGAVFRWSNQDHQVMCSHGAWDDRIKYENDSNTDILIQWSNDSPGITWGDFDLKNRSSSRGAGDINITYNECKNFEYFNPNIKFHLSGHQDKSRFMIFDYNFNNADDSLIKSDNYNDFYTLEESVLEYYTLDDNIPIPLSNYIENKEKLFIAISSLNTPVAPWTNPNLIAYMTCNPIESVPIKKKFFKKPAPKQKQQIELSVTLHDLQTTRLKSKLKQLIDNIGEETNIINEFKPINANNDKWGFLEDLYSKRFYDEPYKVYNNVRIGWDKLDYMNTNKDIFSDIVILSTMLHIIYPEYAINSALFVFHAYEYIENDAPRNIDLSIFDIMVHLIYRMISDSEQRNTLKSKLEDIIDNHEYNFIWNVTKLIKQKRELYDYNLERLVKIVHEYWLTLETPIEDKSRNDVCYYLKIDRMIPDDEQKDSLKKKVEKIIIIATVLYAKKVYDNHNLESIVKKLNEYYLTNEQKFSNDAIEDLMSIDINRNSAKD